MSATQHGLHGPNAPFTPADWWRIGASGARWIKLLATDHTPADARTAARQKVGSDLRPEAIQYLGVSFAEPDWDGDTLPDPVNGLQRAIEFYKQAFGAQELFRMPMGDKIGHAELKIGDSHLMLCDEFPEHGSVSPEALGGSPGSLCLYVENADAVFNRAVDTFLASVARGSWHRRDPRSRSASTTGMS